MLSALRRRMTNLPDTELAIAAREQAKITHTRVQKLLLELAEPVGDAE